MGSKWFSFNCDFCNCTVNYDVDDSKLRDIRSPITDIIFDSRMIRPFTSIFGEMKDGKIIRNKVINGDSEIEICHECVKKIHDFINVELIVPKKQEKLQ